MHRVKTVLSNKINLAIIAVVIICALMAFFVYRHNPPLHKNFPSSANDQDQQILDFQKQYQQQKVDLNTAHTASTSLPFSVKKINPYFL